MFKTEYSYKIRFFTVFPGKDTTMSNDVKTTGTLKVSADAIVSIAEAAAAEIRGVALTSTNKLAVLNSTAIKEKIIKPISVKISADSVSVDISIIVMQSAKAAEVAKAVQNNVKSAIQSMTGIAVSKVNVAIAGICSEE